MKLVSWNVNGVRAAFRNGMPAWLEQTRPEILALQEVRAETEDLVRLFDEFEAERGGAGWHILHDKATAKGRDGCAAAAWPRAGKGSENRLSPAALARIAVRLVNDLVSSGPLQRPATLRGPEGEWIEVVPTRDGRQLQVTVTT